jgi:hypothetical protein
MSRMLHAPNMTECLRNMENKSMFESISYIWRLNNLQVELVAVPGCDNAACLVSIQITNRDSRLTGKDLGRSHPALLPRLLHGCGKSRARSYHTISVHIHRSKDTRTLYTLQPCHSESRLAHPRTPHLEIINLLHTHTARRYAHSLLDPRRTCSRLGGTGPGTVFPALRRAP